MDMGRQRTRDRAGWPDNLYPCKNGYKYRNPVTRKETWVGTDWAKANAAARTLNGMLVPRGNIVGKVLGEGNLVRDAIKQFRTVDMANRQWAPKTADEHEIKLRRIERDIGGAELASFRTKETADFLRTVTDSARARQQYRALLIWIFDCAAEEGWIETNPANATRRGTAKRKRERLTLEGFQAVHAHAPAWLQNAMELSLMTLLRRDDIVNLRFSDLRDGALWAEPRKTQGSTGARIRIALTDDLDALARRCRDAVASPYLVHRLPEKARPSDMRAKKRQHHTQVLPEQLSRAFSDARDQADMFRGVENPPTFHEIRSLGGALLIAQGWTLEQVQQLMTHASGQMTEHYLDGHEKPWIDVRPGITAREIGRK